MPCRRRPSAALHRPGEAGSAVGGEDSVGGGGEQALHGVVDHLRRELVRRVGRRDPHGQLAVAIVEPVARDGAAVDVEFGDRVQAVFGDQVLKVGALGGQKLSNRGASSGSSTLTEITTSPWSLYLLRQLNRVRELGDAGAAPGGPKIDQHDFAFVAGDNLFEACFRYRSQIDRGFVEFIAVGGRATCALRRDRDVLRCASQPVSSRPAESQQQRSRPGASGRRTIAAILIAGSARGGLQGVLEQPE